MSNNIINAISYEDIRVDGYSIQSIRTLCIKNSINNHSTLKMIGIINNENIEDINNTTKNKEIEIYYNTEKRETLFYGIVTNIEVEVIDEVYTIKIEAKSMTYLMDIQVKSRSFQDTSLSVQSLMKLVMDGYKNSSYLLNIPNEKIGELIVQYEETDWQFLKRIVSKYNQGLLPVANFNYITFIAGAENQYKNLQLSKIQYDMYKDLEEYDYMLQNYLNDANEIDYLTYKIMDYPILNLGDYMDLDNKTLYVYECVYEIKNGILENTYKLRMQSGLRQRKIYNTKIIGSSIQGKIIAVKNDVVQIHLEIDDCKSNDVYWFDFSTMSASSDGSGWYCMPEVGDSIRVYFPTKDEDEAFAVSSVSNYEQGADEAEDRMGNPDNKYLRTANNKEVKLTPDGVFISCDGGQADLALKSDGTLNIVSQNNINITAKNNMKIEAEKSFKMTSGQGIYISCDKNGGIDFDEGGQIKEKGIQVKNN
ncbi:late control protein D [Clostridium aquiflavi]|uniref:Late control protein D n=1 Tax=Clostridium aquiflavi TaxID=3073603 RepID=A0ABU1EBZ5_9CLOT|nr:late control protein D [Clostridium sp. 5N-1]MDR5585847.1 late control protein D [Clostridium sp. 5N-1]